MEEAESLDPLSLLITGSRASVLYYARQYHEGLQQCRKALDLDPASWRVLFIKGRILEQLGEWDEAIAVPWISMNGGRSIRT